MKSFSFNGNKSRILMQWVRINQGYFVWREDNGHQVLLRIHNDRVEAIQDFESRVTFTKELAA